jgi:transketolase
MPCWELFDEQTAEYRERVLPASVTARLAVEAGRSLGWERWVGTDGATVSLDRYGASAPGDVVMRELGFTTDRVMRTAEVLVAAERKKSGRR